MSKITKKSRVICNITICCMLLFVFSVAFKNDIKTVFSQSSTVDAIYSGNTQNKKACLMINVYWGDEYIETMLNILQEQGVRTTFFVGGMWANKNAEMLQKIVDAGHELGNHGYFHKDHSTLSVESNKEEIAVCHQTVKTLVGVEMNLFAPPSGAFNSTTLDVVDLLGYKTIMWTKDTIDWRDHDTSLIVKRATKNIKNGDLILMHPTQNTVEALPQIIEQYQQKGITLTTVSDCL